MKVLLINTFEQTGGAAIACQRLFFALLKAGVDVKMLVNEKKSNHPRVISLSEGAFNKRKQQVLHGLERFTVFARNGFTKEGLFASSLANFSADISQHPAVLEADVLHLHWINQGMLSIKNIEKLAATGKPIVWTMHDMWNMLSVEHYAYYCNCTVPHEADCSYLQKMDPRHKNATYFYRKEALYKKAKIHFVTCSQWLKRVALQSYLMKDQIIEAIPNPIDITAFSPQSKIAARQHFHLPEDKKLVLFGAMNVAHKEKGLPHLVEAAHYLYQQFPEEREQIELLILGKSTDVIPDDMFPFKIHRIGFLSEAENISKIYNAADLFVTPSLMDNLPNTIMESMACGTPCVGYHVGGIPEMINHLENGYVATYKSIEDLAKGIHYVLFDPNAASFGKNAREKVEQQYAEWQVAKQYISLYNSIV